MCSGNFGKEEEQLRKKKEGSGYQEILVIYEIAEDTSGAWAHAWLKMMKMIMTVTAVVKKADFQWW